MLDYNRIEEEMEMPNSSEIVFDCKPLRTYVVDEGLKVSIFETNKIKFHGARFVVCKVLEGNKTKIVVNVLMKGHDKKQYSFDLQRDVNEVWVSFIDNFKYVCINSGDGVIIVYSTYNNKLVTRVPMVNKIVSYSNNSILTMDTDLDEIEKHYGLDIINLSTLKRASTKLPNSTLTNGVSRHQTYILDSAKMDGNGSDKEFQLEIDGVYTEKKLLSREPSSLMPFKCNVSHPGSPKEVITLSYY
jgi:hypothetical protein